MPRFIVQTYLRIPPRIRKLWGLKGGVSTAHLALAAINNGEGWSAFRFAKIAWMPFPSWTDPGPQGGIGVSWKGEGGGPHP
jgi:hypothetical protein